MPVAKEGGSVHKIVSKLKIGDVHIFENRKVGSVSVAVCLLKKEKDHYEKRFKLRTKGENVEVTRVA